MKDRQTETDRQRQRETQRETELEIELELENFILQDIFTQMHVLTAHLSEDRIFLHTCMAMATDGPLTSCSLK